MTDDDRPRRRWIGRDALQSSQSADPMTGQPPDFLSDVRRYGCDSVIVVRLDPHDARLLGRTKPEGTRSRA